MLKTLMFALLAALVVNPILASAQTQFPNKPVKMIVPFPAGGGGDILARALADAFNKQTGQVLGAIGNGNGTGEGQFLEASYLTADSRGNLWTGDTARGRITKMAAPQK